ncbi:BMP family lipoprotein [Actinomyces minihominis]|uniref:BMP family lipoprotein n=1 Tax=Actinomyces minihominis TaxID=2002838 RepID=UPI001A91F667|nr:BMP family ABC transporter substrate-binding protein [Actinomyces minihominis]
MKKTMRFGALAAVAALGLAACGSAPDAGTDAGTSGEQSGATEATSDVKACMVSDSGGFEDKSFNQSGYEGLMMAKDAFGIKVDKAESTSDADFIPNIENMVQGGCSIIIGVGFLMADAISESAAQYPDTKFALVDSPFNEPLDNTKALLFNTAEASYLAGYAAAGMSTTGKVGAYLGMNLPSTAIFNDGYVDGVAKYNEVHSESVEVIGWDKAAQDGMATGNFEDVSKGKQFSEQLIQQGVDVIMPVAGPVGMGTLAAAKENPGTMVIWVDADGALTNPGDASVILTSVMKQISAAVYDAIQAVVEGTWTSEAYVGTLANGGVGIAPWHDFEDKVSPELNDEIEQIKQEIIDGTIVVESTNTPK